MGQCGCGDFYPDYTLPGPDGSIYALQVWPGCPECHEYRVALIVSKLSGDEIDAWDARHEKKLELKQVDGADFQERALLVLDPKNLVSCLMDELIDQGWHEDDVQELVLNAVRDAVLKSRKQALEEQGFAV